MIRYVVAGTGHSGTAWAARTLTLLGGRCGHEQVFNFDRPGTLRRIDEGAVWGDSSLAAGAYLDDVEGAPVLHLLRDPLAVVNSWCGAGPASGIIRHPDAPIPTWMAKQVPELADATDDVAAAIIWVAEWSEHITANTRGPYQWRRIEDLDADTLRELCPYLGFLPQPVPRRLPNSDANRHPRADLTWADVDAHPEGPRLRRHAEIYGYL